MHLVHHPLHTGGADAPLAVTSLHFGPAGHRRALLQCGLHADEIPPMLVAQHLRRRLQALEEAGLLLGEVVLLPACNPIGLTQQVWGRLQGRFELASGQNFNRHYPALAEAAARRFAAQGQRLGADPAANARALRAALLAALDEGAEGKEGAPGQALSALQRLRQTLLRLALPAELVLDLHCDNEAVLHLYATPDHEATARQLGRCLGAPLLLLAADSGDAPFDEALSGLWPRLRAHLGEAVPLACFAATVELRGECDVDHALAAADAQGLLHFLQQQGFVREGPPPPPMPTAVPGQAPPPDCVARPLAACLPLQAPATGLLVWHLPVGQWVQAGQPLVDLVCPVTGSSQTLCSPVDGLLFARELQRWARAGQSIAKVAGLQPRRSGKLLSA